MHAATLSAGNVPACHDLKFCATTNSIPYDADADGEEADLRAFKRLPDCS